MNPLIGLPAPGHPGSVAVHYPGTPDSRSALTIAVLVSLGAHLGLLFGLAPARALPRVKPADPGTVIEITVFKPDDVDEPPPLPAEDNAVRDDTPVVPVLVDTPVAPRPDDFVQPLDLSTLVPRPDANVTPLNAIPATFTRNPNPPGAKIFEPRDLERTPVALAQPPPAYPHALRREALTATVIVGFIVDAAGTVVNAHVIDSTHPGFNEAAVSGVSKWKFRAGLRGGRAVNTRMQIPIVFRLIDER